MKMLCPQCGVKGSVDDSYIGRKVKCPKCETAFRVLAEEDLALSQEAEVHPLESSVDEGFAEPVAVDEPGDEPGDESGDDLDEIVSELSVEESTGAKLSDVPAETMEWSDIPAEFDEKIRETDKIPATKEDLNDASDEEPKEADIIVIKEVVDDAAVAPSLTGETALLGEEIQQEPFPIEKERCSLCGKKDVEGEPFIAQGGMLYCTECLPDKEQDMSADEFPVLHPGVASIDSDSGFQSDNFGMPTPTGSISSVISVIKDAWEETKGAKASIWAGTAMMYLVMIVVGAGGVFLMPFLGFDLLTPVGMGVNAGIQILLSVVSVVFTASLLYMGVRKVAGDAVSWQMIFYGFSYTGKIVLAILLQSILVSLGILFLVLPGIYLAVGYALTLPLILDRKMSVWQAMEASRKAIHKVWWKVTGVLSLMSIIYVISVIPLGIGLIWTMPMFIILVGVLYRCLFGVEKTG